LSRGGFFIVDEALLYLRLRSPLANLTIDFLAEFDNLKTLNRKGAVIPLLIYRVPQSGTKVKMNL
jgi:hypothetical protein